MHSAKVSHYPDERMQSKILNTYIYIKTSFLNSHFLKEVMMLKKMWKMASVCVEIL